MALISKIFTLQTPNTSTLRTRYARIDVTATGRVHLQLKVDLATYERIDKNAWFNLRPEMRHETFVDAFSKHRDIEIVARLDPAVAETLPADAEAIADAIRSAPLDAPCRRSENYYGLNVAQRVHPRIKAGYNTRWADEELEE